ncbi:uncharacterized protein LOC115444605 [Manduca sexta]|uniref:uncharacterized protein LOC115444605 n=1 Tax=Manduca sexta TaxID=7130 RepID=UPI001183A32B|nr:uncharacterized protein LOC115444605 [Manduca sexta]
MPSYEAPCVELGSAPQTPSVVASPSPSEISSASSPEPQNIRATPLFRALAMTPPEPEQPPGQEELERRLPGYRRIVIPRELTLIELLKQSSGVVTDEEVLQIREAKLRVVAERVGLRRLNVLAPRLRSLTLDGSVLSSLRDLGIGLVHLKTLSINRCGLNSLDGVWGLGALRELHAAGNRLQDLQPLAALQKLQTLNLADNPISENGRLWTLGVCGSLRRLTLRGTPMEDSLHYRSRVASALPMLVYLDDRPLHVDIQYDSDEIFDIASLSDSDKSDAEDEANAKPEAIDSTPIEPEPGPSSRDQLENSYNPEEDKEVENTTRVRLCRRRPATTEGVGSRPQRPELPPRPRTAVDRPNIEEPTRLQILNTLMDEEWRCSGSKLTSCGAVCGNLARALRRPTAYFQRRSLEAEKELVEQTMQDATRALAAEIPRAPRLEDWAKFKQETGIDIDIDFSRTSADVDSSQFIERLEQIEKETSERLKHGDNNDQASIANLPNAASIFTDCTMASMSELDIWRAELPTSSTRDLFTLFNDLDNVWLGNNAKRYADNDDSQVD